MTSLFSLLYKFHKILINNILLVVLLPMLIGIIPFLVPYHLELVKV